MSRPPCVTCGIPLVSNHKASNPVVPPGARRHYGRGMCTACYQQARRDEHRAAVAAHRPPRDWRDQAACRDEDPELFFPVGNTGPALQQIEEAKAVCARCDVVTTCRQWALDTRQESGVWGGTSEDERIRERRRTQRGARS